MKLIVMMTLVLTSSCSTYLVRDPAKEKNQQYIMTPDLNGQRIKHLKVGLHQPIYNQNQVVDFKKVPLDLMIEADYNQFIQIVEQLYDVSALQKSQEQNEPQIKNKDSDIVFDYRSKGINHGLLLAQQIIAQIGKTSDETQKLQLKLDLAEIVQSIENNFIPGARSDYEALTLPITLLKQISFHRLDSSVDVNLADPSESSFWHPVSQFNFYSGVSRYGKKAINETVCEFTEAKYGYGFKAGFKADCAGLEYKVKFGGETYSGPFNSRIYNALGYTTPAIEYTEGIHLKYDRRILSEINSRKAQNLKLTVLGMGGLKKSILKHYNPFTLVEFATLKNGQKISSQQLAQMIIKPGANFEDLKDSDFIAEAESNLQSLNMIAGSVIEKLEGDQVGAWSFNDLGHGSRTELKGLLVLAAWTNDPDLRLDNNRLYIVRTEKTQKIVHMLSDPGYGMGQPRFPYKGGDLNTIPWEITRQGSDSQGEIELRKEFVEFNEFNEMERNKAFDHITYADGKWMVRKIAKLTEAQITEALAASGLAAAELILVREKLINSRNKMIVDFGLANEFPMRTTDRKISFNPLSDVMKVTLSTGELIEVPNRGIQLVNGTLVYP